MNNLIAGRRFPARLVRQILDLRDTERSARSSSCKLACYVQDAAKRLAAHGDRGPARQIAPWVLLDRSGRAPNCRAPWIQDPMPKKSARRWSRRSKAPGTQRV